MGFIDSVQKDARQIHDYAKTFFQWPTRTGKIFSCVPDKFTREVMVSDDGNPESIDLSLSCLVDAFANHTFPKSGQLVRFPINEDGSDLPDSKDYRVRRTRSKQFAILWVDCIDENV